VLSGWLRGSLPCRTLGRMDLGSGAGLETRLPVGGFAAGRVPERESSFRLYGASSIRMRVPPNGGSNVKTV